MIVSWPAPPFRFIDYSQYKAYIGTCPFYWYEKYVNQMEKPRLNKYNDDALTIGSLTHNGLENWAKLRVPRIDNSAVLELLPSPEALALANMLVQAYVQRYPAEEFAIERTEVPLTFPLDGTDTQGLALIDNHFYNERECQIESGIEGERFTLQPGWWIREYKTKAASQKRALFQMSWECNMQADFQILALSRKVGEPVQGLFVCVLEKPTMTIPKRKCKGPGGCGNTYELRAFLSTGEGLHACPVCGCKQALTPYTPKVEKHAEIYRIPVQRSAERLIESRRQITIVAQQMDAMRRSTEGFAMNQENCVNRMFGPCAYFNNHIYGQSTLDDANLVKRDATRYVRLEQLVREAA